MAAPSSVNELLDLTQKSGVVEDGRLAAYIQQLRASGACPVDPSKLAGLMIRDGLLTLFQAEQLLAGKWKRFFVGKYKVLEKLGSGGMGQVFLCEHKIMRRRVAVKVLPTAKADDPSALERFRREARAVAALDHPNIVRAYDIDEDGGLHFFVMEFVDGKNFQDLVKGFGPMAPLRACHYVYQAAHGLQHAFDMAGLIHRDIKPGNILIDRTGTVKILDMGLARFFHDEQDLLTKMYDENVLGTADYLAPEQAMDSHSVDIRADIYSLGATFYFMLTGSPPYADGTVAQKLMWHHSPNIQPKPIHSYRRDVSPGIVAIIQKMMAKEPRDRYQSPRELAEALTPLVATPVPPPPEQEMPRLSPAATNNLNIVGPSAPPSRVMAPVTPPPSRANTATSQADFLIPAPSALATAAPRQPAAARSRPTVQQAPPMSDTVPANGTGEHVPIWTEIAGETPNPKAHSDTIKSRPSYKAPSAALAAPSATRLPSTSSRTRWLLFVVGGLAMAALIGGLFAAGVLGGKKPKSAATGPATPPDPAGTRTLIVDTGATASPGTYRRVHDALANAKTGDRILVRGETIREAWAGGSAKAHYAKGLTIEGDVQPGHYVTWKFTPVTTVDDYVLNLEGVEGVTFRRIAFDGENKARLGIYMTGKCSDVVFDDVRILNCADTAVRLSNATGTPEKPIRFSKVRVSAEKGARSALDLLSASASMAPTGSVVIEDSQFDGPFQTFMNIQGTVRDFTFRRNRCWNAAIAVLVVKPAAPAAPAPAPVAPVELKLQLNTFHTVNQKTLSLEGVTSGENKIDVSQNYFAGCKGLVNSPDGKPIPNAVLKSNFRDPGSSDGNWKIDMPLADAAFKLDPNDIEFLRYPKSSPLAKIADGQPVGAPPVD